MPPRLQPDGFERLILFDRRRGYRVDVRGDFALAGSTVGGAAPEFFDSAEGPRLELSRQVETRLDVLEGRVMETASDLLRLSGEWSVLGLGMVRHYIDLADAPMVQVPARQGAGGFAAESYSLARTTYDPEQEHADNVLALLGWLDLCAQASGAGGFDLRRKRSNGTVDRARSYAWSSDVTATADAAAGTLVFADAWALTGKVPFPAPGARVRLEGPPGATLALAFQDVNGGPLASVAESVTGTPQAGQVRTATAPPGAFFVVVSLSGAAGAVARPRLYVEEAGQPDAAFVVTDYDPAACPDFAPGGGGQPGGSECVPPEAPENLAGARNGEQITWTWGAVQDADSYLFRWGIADGGPYPNIVEVLSADLADPGAPTLTLDMPSFRDHAATVQAVKSIP